MLAPAQLDNTTFAQQGFRLILKCGIAVMLLFCVASFVALAQQPARVAALSAATDTALQSQQANLEAQVTERTAALQQAMGDLEARAAEQQRLLAQTEQQRDAIRALSLPILPINQTTLAAPLIGTFDAQRLAELQRQVLVAIERSGARALVLDITSVPAVDQEVALGLLRVAQAARLLGASGAAGDSPRGCTGDRRPGRGPGWAGYDRNFPGSHRDGSAIGRSTNDE